MRRFKAPDGIEWGVEVALPGSSNVMVIFRHPDGRSARRDRYNWFISKGPEARSVTSRLAPEKVAEHLDDTAIGMLFSRSMPVSRPAIEPNYALGLGGGAVGHSRGIGKVDH
ncbi:MAG: hypothetical protein ACRENU_03565 [Gemmatimonadaceae bacterium]